MDSTSTSVPGSTPSKSKKKKKYALKKYPRAGRPTTYKARYCQDIVAYFSQPCDSTFFPTVPGFAASIGSHKQRLYEWCEQYEEFRDSFRQSISFAESALTVGAMTRKYDAGFSRFLACNYMSLAEKQDVKVSGAMTNNLTGGIEIRFIDSTNQGQIL